MADPVTDQPGALLARMPAIVAVDDGVGQPPTAPAPGESFPMQDNVVHYAGQPIAIVVAESHEGAQYAAAQVAVSYEPVPSITVSTTAATRMSAQGNGGRAPRSASTCCRQFSRSPADGVKNSTCRNSRLPPRLPAVCSPLHDRELWWPRFESGSRRFKPQRGPVANRDRLRPLHRLPQASLFADVEPAPALDDPRSSGPTPD
jgi:hypothetical protein